MIEFDELGNYVDAIFADKIFPLKFKHYRIYAEELVLRLLSNSHVIDKLEFSHSGTIDGFLGASLQGILFCGKRFRALWKIDESTISNTVTNYVLESLEILDV